MRSVTGPGGAVEIPVNTGTTISLDGLEWQATIGYALVSEPSLSLEILGGFRFLDVSFDLDWQFDGPLNLLPQSGQFSQSVKPLDAIIGVRGVSASAMATGSRRFISTLAQATPI